MKYLLTLLASALSLCTTALAQDYEPTTTWPYICRDFMEGDLVMGDGQQRNGLYNVCVLDSRLHFIDGELVKEASPADVLHVRLGQDRYINAGGRMMKVLAESEHGIVAEETLADLTRLNETGGAYGSSSSSMATTALSSISMGPRINISHMELKNSKSEGKILPLTSRIYLLVGMDIIYATRKDVSQTAGVDKDAFKLFCKEHKIKWKDPQSLLGVIDFLSGQKGGGL